MVRAFPQGSTELGGNLRKKGKEYYRKDNLCKGPVARGPCGLKLEELRGGRFGEEQRVRKRTAGARQ